VIPLPRRLHCRLRGRPLGLIRTLFPVAVLVFAGAASDGYAQGAGRIDSRIGEAATMIRSAATRPDREERQRAYTAAKTAFEKLRTDLRHAPTTRAREALPVATQVELSIIDQLATLVDAHLSDPDCLERPSQSCLLALVSRMVLSDPNGRLGRYYPRPQDVALTQAEGGHAVDLAATLAAVPPSATTEILTAAARTQFRRGDSKSGDDFLAKAREANLKADDDERILGAIAIAQAEIAGGHGDAAARTLAGALDRAHKASMNFADTAWALLRIAEVEIDNSVVMPEKARLLIAEAIASMRNGDTGTRVILQTHLVRIAGKLAARLKMNGDTRPVAKIIDGLLPATGGLLLATAARHEAALFAVTVLAGISNLPLAESTALGIPAGDQRDAALKFVIRALARAGKFTEAERLVVRIDLPLEQVDAISTLFRALPAHDRRGDTGRRLLGRIGKIDPGHGNKESSDRIRYVEGFIDLRRSAMLSLSGDADGALIAFKRAFGRESASSSEAQLMAAYASTSSIAPKSPSPLFDALDAMRQSGSVEAVARAAAIALDAGRTKIPPTDDSSYLPMLAASLIVLGQPAAAAGAIDDMAVSTKAFVHSAFDTARFITDVRRALAGDRAR